MKKIHTLLAVFFIICFTPIHAQDPGDLDDTFGYNGFRFISYGDLDSYANSIGILSNGKIILAGYLDSLQQTDFIITCLDTEGYIDYTFGDDGFKRIDMNAMDEFLDLQILDDDCILLVGYTGGNLEKLDYSGILMKLEPDGSYDDFFGTNGIVELSLDNQTRFTGLAIQDDGKIVISGHSGNVTDGMDAIIGRFNSDGSQDMTFSTDGFAYFDQYDTDKFEDVCLHDDGRIVASGSVFNEGELRESLVARFNPDGSIDDSFNGSGFNTTLIYDDDYANSILVQGDGKIVTGGSGYSNVTNRSVMMLCRYNTDGTTDETFAYSGYIAFGGDYDVWGYDIIQQPDGKIIICGEYTTEEAYTVFVLVRINESDGFPDSEFGTFGWVTTPFDYSNAVAKSMILQEDGNLLAAGIAYQDDFDRYNVAVARYHTGLFVDSQEIELEKPELTLYPNPAKDQLHVEYVLQNKQLVSFELYDLTGNSKKVLMKENRGKGKHLECFGLSDLRSGSYYILYKIGSKKEMRMLQVIK